ncbi:MAG TPA: HU family DNA-binding protein [Burkholderiales bacterium]|nr:HU family DNA-binding protein [Burkholderiales bacterium]
MGRRHPARIGERDLRVRRRGERSRHGAERRQCAQCKHGDPPRRVIINALGCARRASIVFPICFGYDDSRGKQCEGEEMGHVVTKSDLVQVAAKAGNLSRAAAGEAVNAVFDAIVENVAKGKRVTVVGFGTFLPRKRKARSGRSPVNGKEIRISAKTLPAFAAGQGFKEAVDKT